MNAIVEAQPCGLGLAVNKISVGPDLPTISFTQVVFFVYTFAVRSAHGITVGLAPQH